MASRRISGRVLHFVVRGASQAALVSRLPDNQIRLPPLLASPMGANYYYFPSPRGSRLPDDQVRSLSSLAPLGAKYYLSSPTNIGFLRAVPVRQLCGTPFNPKESIEAMEEALENINSKLDALKLRLSILEDREALIKMEIKEEMKDSLSNKSVDHPYVGMISVGAAWILFYAYVFCNASVERLFKLSQYTDYSVS